MLKSILIAALIVGAYMSSILNETENNTLLSERKKIFSRIILSKETISTNPILLQPQCKIPTTYLW